MYYKNRLPKKDRSKSARLREKTEGAHKHTNHDLLVGKRFINKTRDIILEIVSSKPKEAAVFGLGAKPNKHNQEVKVITNVSMNPFPSYKWMTDLHTYRYYRCIN